MRRVRIAPLLLPVFAGVALGALTIEPASLPVGQVGTSYNAQLSTSGNQGQVVWTLLQSNLPPGFVFDTSTNSTGGTLCTGVFLADGKTVNCNGVAPSTAQGSAWLLNVMANDAQGNQSATKMYALTVVAENPPSITSTSPLPLAVVGEAYAYQFMATGGAPPLRWIAFTALNTFPASFSLSSTGLLSSSQVTPADFAARPGGLYTFAVQVLDSNNRPSLAVQFNLTISQTRVPTKVGIVRSTSKPGAVMIAEDVNGNLAWDPGIDHAYFFGSPGDILIQGDWDASGTTKLGIFRPGSAMFALDMNGNGAWDPGIDRYGFFGQNGDVPIVGDWTGDGKSKIGIFRPTTNLFALDVNNNLAYDAGADKAGQFGVPGDVPIVGDWTGDGVTKIGIYRPSTSLFAEDVNNNLTWDPGIDKAGVFGVLGDAPIVGDWTGGGISQIGIYRRSTSLWALDVNSNLTWDPGTDTSGVFGAPGDLWVVGDWDASGVSRAGIFRPSAGLWGLDLNGNLAWDAGTDLSGVFGASGDLPVVGRWH